MNAPDDSLQALARDLEQAGHAEFAARLAVLIEHLDPYLLPQIAVGEPAPEPGEMPALELVELTERPTAKEEA